MTSAPNQTQLHEGFMRQAIEQAKIAARRGDIPIGAVIVTDQGEIIARAGNSREQHQDPTAHAEILALRAAGAQLGDWRIARSTMYVTLEPCPMCAGAITMARVPQLVIGSWNEEYGAVGSRWDLVRDQRMNHQVEVIPGVLENETGQLVREFFSEKR
ncbi:nucleoside deaminase [Candidatus Nanopelagicales bacterium]|nr:nucleoside deaminase [Candidatus Nanopelagicales bacterium]